MLIKRTVNFPLIAILYAINQYLYLANQIRFFLGWPLMLLAIWSFYKKEYFAFALLAVLAVLSHKSLILLPVAVFCTDFVVRRVGFYKALTILVFISVVIGLFTWCDFGNGIGMNQLRSYQNKSAEATLVGALYNFLPYAFILVLVANIHIRIKKSYPQVLDDLLYRYLLVLSLSPMLFLGFGFYVMIFTQRFAESMVLIWMMYFYYGYVHYSDKSLKEGIGLTFGVVYLLIPFSSTFYSLVKGEFHHGMEILKSLMSYTLFT